MNDKTTDWYLSQISSASNKFGNLLCLLMDLNNKNCLKYITLEEAKTFYELIEDGTINKDNLDKILLE